jgi:two-component system nitrate/nitrite response regulator NarL
MAENPPSGIRSDEPGDNELTISESEVLSAVAQGQSNNVIARNLGMAEATVKIHLASLMRKIKAHNRVEAAIWALSNLPVEGRPGRGFV